MKVIQTIFLAILAGSALAEAGDLLKLEKLKLKTGREYDKVTITSKRPDGISISHESGTAQIKFEDLPEDVAAKLGGFNPQAAATSRKQTEAAETVTLNEIDKGIAAQKAAGNSNIGKTLDFFKGKYGKPIAVEPDVASFKKADIFIMVIFDNEKAVRLAYSKVLVNQFGQTEAFTENEFAAIGESNASGGGWEESEKTTFSRTYISGEKLLSCYFDIKENTITVSSREYNRKLNELEKKKLKGL